jgi:hypothetical protein
MLPVVVLLLTGACTVTSSPSSVRSASSEETSAPPAGTSPPLGWSSYQANGLRFQYPPGSRVRHFREITPAFDSLAYVSDQPMTNPCRPVSAGSGAGVCGLAVKTLMPAKFLVEWLILGLPIRSFEALPGRVIEVSGRLAKLAIDRPGQCQTVRADVTVKAVVRPSAGATWYEFLGCIRGPGAARLLSRAMGILHSTTLPQ